jgi:hypothetical protein
MENKNQKPDGKIPKVIINQLGEHTSGGFILFYFNAEDGSPEELMTFDSPAHCLALKKHIGDWSAALQDLNIESERRHFEKICKQDEENGEDNDVI